MAEATQTFLIGQKASLSGHCDAPAVLKAARPLRNGCGCRARLLVRRIEVKGRKPDGNVVLAMNERFKARQLDEHCWLCVVGDLLGQSRELVLIQNPVRKLDHAKREIIAARNYEIPADTLQEKRGAT